MEFKTWKTIKLGTGLKTGDEFRRALKAVGRGIAWRCEDDINNILYDPSTFKVASEETEVELVNVSVAEIGFKSIDLGGSILNDVYTRAQERGLEICPAEVGPQLCLQYSDPPITKEAESLNIGMEPVITAPGENWERIISIFMIYNNSGELGLMTTNAGPTIPFGPNRRFVFKKRK